MAQWRWWQQGGLEHAFPSSIPLGLGLCILIPREPQSGHPGETRLQLCLAQPLLGLCHLDMQVVLVGNAKARLHQTLFGGTRSPDSSMEAERGGINPMEMLSLHQLESRCISGVKSFCLTTPAFPSVLFAVPHQDLPTPFSLGGQEPLCSRPAFIKHPLRRGQACPHSFLCLNADTQYIRAGCWKAEGLQRSLDGEPGNLGAFSCLSTWGNQRHPYFTPKLTREQHPAVGRQQALGCLQRQKMLQGCQCLSPLSLALCARVFISAGAP